MPKNEANKFQPQSQTISHATDWYGPDDTDNPRNFGLWLRTLSTSAVTLLAFVTTFAASIYPSGVEDVKKEFDISQEVAILPLSSYNVGLALGPLIGAPMCETLGRKIVFLVTSPVFALFILGSGFSHNIASLTICRFFAGVFAAPAVGNASATITDYTAGRYRSISMACYYSSVWFGAVLGPLVGGFVVQAKGWRWTQYTTIFFIVAFYIPICFTRETYKKIILQRRATKLGVEGPTARENDRSVAHLIKHFLTTLLVRPVHMLLTEPIVTLVCVYSGFLFGLMYTFVTVSSWIYKHYYNFDTTGQSLSFLGLDVGTILAPFPSFAIDILIYQPRLKKFQSERNSLEDDRFPPENRLFAAMLGSLLLPTALFTFAWTTRPSIHWIVPIIFQGLAIMSSVLIYASANLFMIDTYGPLYGASAAGAAMMTRYILSAAFPLFSLQMYQSLGVGWATSLLAFCTVAMAPIPWLFWRCGESLRRRTKYETSA